MTRAIELTVALDPLDLNAGISRLEAVLGLSHPALPSIDRVLRFMGAIEAAKPLAVWDSFRTDRLGTARHLLRRREDALLAGWNGTSGNVPVLETLAIVERALRQAYPRGIDSLADRTLAIESALTHGLRLRQPIQLCGALKAFSARWQAILSLLEGVTSVLPHQADTSQAPATSALGAFQKALGDTIRPTAPDASLAWTRVGSRTAAAQALASLFASRPIADVARTVVICGQADVLVAIDDRLRRAGIPGLGAPSIGRHTALDGVLPLALGLCWQPVDAELLLELCLVPGGPVGYRAGARLGNALTRFPGLGSRSWTKAYAEVTSPENDPQAVLQKRLVQWFEHPRVALGESVPARLLTERCSVVARWAGQRMASEASPDGPYTSLAGAAARLGGAIALLDRPVSPSDLARLVAEATTGSATARHHAEAGGPLLVATPADIPPGTQRVIWLDPIADAGGGCGWTSAELRSLAREGLTIDDGMAQATARRAADRNGLRRISESLVVMEVVGPEPTRQHPAVIALLQCLDQARAPTDQVARLDDVVGHPMLQLGGWHRQGVVATRAAASGPRLLWNTSGGVIPGLSSASYTELSLRLACPVAWTFTHVLKLSGGPAAALPELHQLEGTFAHAVLEGVFGGPVPDPGQAAAAALVLFDERIAIDAAPLTSPGQGARRGRLRHHVSEAARTLALALRAAGCTEVVMEARIQAQRDGIALKGSIDCLATGTGLAVVIDIKLGSLRERRADLEAGQDIQLAVYAATRSEARVYTGYYIINGPRLLTAGDDPIPGIATLGPVVEAVGGAPGWQQTWSRFRAAIVGDQSWHQGQAIPARPLSDPTTWPAGADLVLATDADLQECCRYCDFGSLCGLVEHN